MDGVGFFIIITLIVIGAVVTLGITGVFCCKIHHLGL